MKRILLAIIFAHVSLSLCAQSFLTFQTNAFRAGDKISQECVDYIEPGCGGNDQIWDFSNFPAMKNVQVEYVNIPDSDSLSVTAFRHRERLQYQMSSDTVRLINYTTPLYNINYTIPLLTAVYPFYYGDRSTGFYAGYGDYCGKDSVHIQGEVFIEGDGYGKIVLSETDTLFNVLRLHITRSASVLVGIACEQATDGGNARQRIIDSYKWYARGYRYPIAETVTTTWYNDMTQVSTHSSSYLCLPELQILSGDSVNNSIIRADLDKREHNEGKSSTAKDYHYTIKKEGNYVKITHTLNKGATVNTLLCNHTGYVYQRRSEYFEAGNGCYTQIDLSGLRQGIYILYIQVGDLVFSEKIEV